MDSKIQTIFNQHPKLYAIVECNNGDLHPAIDTRNCAGARRVAKLMCGGIKEVYLNTDAGIVRESEINKAFGVRA